MKKRTKAILIELIPIVSVFSALMLLKRDMIISVYAVLLAAGWITHLQITRVRCTQRKRAVMCALSGMIPGCFLYITVRRNWNVLKGGHFLFFQ